MEIWPFAISSPFSLVLRLKKKKKKKKKDMMEEHKASLVDGFYREVGQGSSLKSKT